MSDERLGAYVFIGVFLFDIFAMWLSGQVSW
jgi:hypothetical protein